MKFELIGRIEKIKIIAIGGRIHELQNCARSTEKEGGES